MSDSVLRALLYGGCALVAIVAAAMYRLGRRAGMGAANRWWANWTGLTVEDVEQRKFDRELRELRRRIGRPSDAWPEQARED